ncbi:alpha/beta hydrolase [Treponema sp.]|uniref:alpha/beta hydrolase n=1 Tax=Treponema sp. TaxID=166 RepID=UPI0025D74235|nr:alpha/beta hydrolase [Treponema sp.]MCR5217633.1 alpha/beta hydrolase [Treponema sp.]
MLHETIELPVNYRGKIENNNFVPFIKTYILENFEEYSAGRKRPLVLICPGGAYEMLSTREGEAVALKMNSLGFHAVTLWYSLKPMEFPASLLDLCEAVKYVRSHAEEWNVDSEKIIVAGFSAGGHLAASLGVYWNNPLIQKYLPYSAADVKPDGLMLAYPVITSNEFAHRDSINNVIGCSKEYSQEDVKLEDHVTPKVPPVFMWHTYEDGCVPVENSLLFAMACKKNNVPLEYHVFRRGGHGLSLATKETTWNNGTNPAGIQKECQVWPELFAEWMESL